MTAQPSKPRPRKKELKFADLTPFRKGRPNPARDDRFDRASPSSRYSKAAEDFESMCLDLDVTKMEYDGDIPMEKSELKDKVCTFFHRVERVTLHVLDRISTLALKGVDYYEKKRA